MGGPNKSYTPFTPSQTGLMGLVTISICSKLRTRELADGKLHFLQFEAGPIVQGKL